MASAISRVGHALLGHRVQAAAGRRLLQPEHRHPRRIRTVHRGPPVRALAGVADDTLLARDARQVGDETVVAHAVDGRREPQAHHVHALLDVLQGEVLRTAARGLRAVERRRVALGRGPVVRERGHPRGQQEGPVAAGERVADRLHGAPLGGVGVRGVGEVVLVGEVDDRLGRLGAGAQRVEVVQVAAADACPLGLQRGGRGVRAGQAGDRVALGQQLVHHGRADPAGRPGDEYVHVVLPRRCVVSVTDVGH